MDWSLIPEWLKDLWAIIKSLESLLILLGLFLAWHLLRRERLKIAALVEDLGQRVETSIQQSRAAMETAEAALTKPEGATQNGGTAAPWETIRSDWQNVRDRLELAIEQIQHKSTRKKYAKFTRYNYNDIIIALRDDQEISQRAFNALIGMNGLFLRLRARPTNATPSDVAQFQGWLADVNGSLPKLLPPRSA